MSDVLVAQAETTGVSARLTLEAGILAGRLAHFLATALPADDGAIADRLSSLLAFDDDAPANVIEFVCHRRAEIVADPGWIELRFSLDDVSTELRRAGLDLDPGYVTWLGFVLKFTYE